MLFGSCMKCHSDAHIRNPAVMSELICNRCKVPKHRLLSSQPSIAAAVAPKEYSRSAPQSVAGYPVIIDLMDDSDFDAGSSSQTSHNASNPSSTHAPRFHTKTSQDLSLSTSWTTRTRTPTTAPIQTSKMILTLEIYATTPWSIHRKTTKISSIAAGSTASQFDRIRDAMRHIIGPGHI